MKRILCILSIGLCFFAATEMIASEPILSEPIDFGKLSSPILLRGDEKTAYRDPAVTYHNGTFYLFCTKVSVEENNDIFAYTVQCTSKDLQHWTEPKTITPRDQNLNYSSPGNVIQYGKQWILCLQTYPRPGAKWQPNGKVFYGNDQARIFIMRSSDLVQWSEPELLKVLGANVPREKMGRMIDPYIIEDRNEQGKYWCFFKQNGQIAYSYSRNLIDWTFRGKTASGENPCVISYKNGYRLFYSPHNGIACKTSEDLINWKDIGSKIVLGQKDWLWAQGRLTAGFVLDMKNEPKIGKYLMFFHGGLGPKMSENWTNFDINCNIGLAWSDDLETWSWASE
ncbi:MAG: hypothetical protein LBQ50_02410 [Planctomycetaceae bacterium]|nr:hypothetical protein [Planctomycetaceae bacterium]